jgi:hypothetical protein
MDISKCTNDECPMRRKCFRWLMKPNEFNQYYDKFEFEIIEEKTDEDEPVSENEIVKCNHFLAAYLSIFDGYPIDEEKQ